MGVIRLDLGIVSVEKLSEEGSDLIPTVVGDELEWTETGGRDRSQGAIRTIQGKMM